MEYLTLEEVRAALPTRPAMITVRRWVSSGCQGHQLRSVRFGKRRLVRRDWLNEFIAAVTGDPDRVVAHLEAERALDRLGV